MIKNERFELIPHCNNENIWYNLFDNQELEYVANVWASGEKICNLLNKQHEENEQLKQQIQSINKDLTQIMLILLDDDILQKLTETELNAFERLSKFKVMMGMSEKRFEFANDGLTIYDNTNNDHIGFDDDLENLLNAQHEKLENRKQIIKTITNRYNELEQAKNSLLEENEQLKQQIQSILKLTKKIEDCTYDIKMISEDVR